MRRFSILFPNPVYIRLTVNILIYYRNRKPRQFYIIHKRTLMFQKTNNGFYSASTLSEVCANQSTYGLFTYMCCLVTGYWIFPGAVIQENFSFVLKVL